MNKEQINRDLHKIYLKALNSHKVGWVGIMLKDISDYIIKLINK